MMLLEKSMSLDICFLHAHETVAKNKWRLMKQPRYGHANFNLHLFMHLFPKQFPLFGSHSCAQTRRTTAFCPYFFFFF
ncbi:hypothetical protein VIGAN_10225000, partial [Vigna angularis var. angularis]